MFKKIKKSQTFSFFLLKGSIVLKLKLNCTMTTLNLHIGICYLLTTLIKKKIYSWYLLKIFSPYLYQSPFFVKHY